MRLVLLVTVVVVAVASCGGGGGGPEGVATTGAPADEVASVAGSPEEPLPAGTPVTLAGWEVTVGDVVASEVGPDEEFPEMGAPDAGHVHVTSHVEAVRVGPEPGKIASFDDGFRLGLMSGGVEVGDYVALPLDDEIDGGVVAPGAVVDGAMLVSANVPADAVDGAVVMVFDHEAGNVAYVATG